MNKLKNIISSVQKKNSHLKSKINRNPKKIKLNFANPDRLYLYW